MKPFKTELLQSAKTLLLALILSMGVSYVYAWTGPTATAPNNNTPAPVNVGSTIQVKSGGLGVADFIANSVTVGGTANASSITAPRYCIGTSCITSWPAGGQVGPQGPAGPQGPTGPQGSAGANGVGPVWKFNIPGMEHVSSYDTAAQGLRGVGIYNQNLGTFTGAIRCNGGSCGSPSGNIFWAGSSSSNAYYCAWNLTFSGGTTGFNTCNVSGLPVNSVSIEW